jgi:hypothetical protein
MGECHGGAANAVNAASAACSAALRPNGDRAAFRGRGADEGRPGKISRAAPRRTKGWLEASGLEARQGGDAFGFVHDSDGRLPPTPRRGPGNGATQVLCSGILEA